jgi:gliding motility-associated-like protein
LKKIALHITSLLLAVSCFAQSPAQKKKEPLYTDAFIHEATELYDWSAIEKQLGEDLKLMPHQVNDLLNFIFRSGDESMMNYLRLVKKGDITEKNAQHYWLKQVPRFEKLYSETYLPYRKTQISALRQGPGNNTVMTGGENCNNLDFGNGTTSGWYGMWNDQGGTPGINIYGDLTVTGLNSSASFNNTGTVHQLCTPGPASYIPINRVPPGHNYSLRLGNDSAYRILVDNGQNSILPYNHQIISNTFTVTEANKAISYWYAVALSQYNPNNHSAFIQPYFKIRMYDGSGNEIVCAQYDVNALTAQSIGGFNTVSTSVPNSGGSLPYDLFYKDWSQVMIPLSDYIGQNVTITFETSDCAGGGHFGYAYVAVDCAPLPNITVSPIPCQGANGTLTGPGGAASYSWSGPGIVSGGNSQTVSVNTAGTYTVTMTTLGNSGFTCSFSVDTTIGTPPPGPTADFTYEAVCAGVPTQFTDASNGNGGTITSWHWDFGDGTQSTSFNPTHTYAVGFGSNATVSYTVTTSTGCSDVYTTVVNLNQGSQAAFTTNTVCVGGTTLFTNTTPGSGNTYVWDYGDGSGTSTLDNPSHIFPSASSFNVSLTVTTPQGCTNTATLPVTINAPPTANFTHSLACAGSTVNFTNTSSVLTGSYNWNFGDPSTTADVSTISNPSYQYNTAGTYTVSLNIDAGNNCIANTTHTLSVSPIPTATIAPYPLYCPGELVPDPSIQSTPASGVNYSWTNNNTQTGMNSAGAGSPPAFTAAANSTGSIVSGVVTVTPVLNGCPGPVTTYTVGIKPTPSVIPPSIQLCPDETSPLINLNSAPASGATTYSWTNTTPSVFIGLSAAGGTSSIPSFTTVNTTAVAQSNLISATATLNGCVSAPSTFPIVVNPYPVAGFNHSRACDGSETNFFSQSTIGTGSITQWLWDLDNDWQYDDASNANASTLLNPVGFHTVGLEVISDKGCKAYTSQDIYVNHTPIVDFVGDRLEGCPLLPVSFTGSASVPPPAQVIQYSWDLGNLNTSTDEGPVSTVYGNDSHTENAYYSVSLEVTTDSGCVGSEIKANYITVYPEPKADFDWGPKDVDIIDPTVYFGDLSIGGSGEFPLIWYLADPTATLDTNNYTTVENPVHTYPYVEADYVVFQYVSNTYGCKDTTSEVIHINGAFTFYIPNAFSPNGRDHLNSGFKGTGIGINNNTYSLLVFDRWGMQLFESHDLEEEWDGKFKDAPVQEDVYVWKVNFEDYAGNGHQYAGTVTIVR